MGVSIIYGLAIRIIQGQLLTPEASVRGQSFGFAWPNVILERYIKSCEELVNTAGLKFNNKVQYMLGLIHTITTEISMQHLMNVHY